MSTFPLFPESASTLSSWVDAVFAYEMVICVFFTLLVLVLIVFFSLKYRKGSSANRSNPVTHSTPLEVFWIGIPTLIALSLFVFSTYVFFWMYDYPRDATEIYVLGKRWMWEINHKEGRREINALHIPVGRPIRLTMTSEDVIHSFYIPAFRTKQDVVPGRYSSMWFQATKPGTYHLRCTEYCGTEHSYMIGEVVVMEPNDFQEWLASGSVKESMAAEGEKLFRSKGCSGCHGRNATVRAPMLDGVFGHAVPLSTGEVVTADERYIRDSIRLPRSQIVAGYEPVMPAFDDRLSEGDLLKIISYIKSIGDTESAKGER